MNCNYFQHILLTPFFIFEIKNPIFTIVQFYFWGNGNLFDLRDEEHYGSNLQVCDD